VNLIEQNKKDETLLRRVDLAPLDRATPGVDEELATAIDACNQAQERVLARFKDLTERRQALAEPGAWLNRDWADLAEARSSARRESWDAVIELRRVVEVRAPVLASMRQAVRRRQVELEGQREQLVKRTAKKMSSEREKYVKVNPQRGAMHFMNMVVSTEPVEAADEEIRQVRQKAARLDDFHLHVIDAARAVGNRQEELFAATDH